MNTEARSSLGVAQNKQKLTHKTCMHSAEIAWTLSLCPFGLIGGHAFQHLEDVPGDACAAPGEISLGGRSGALAWPCPSGEELASLREHIGLLLPGLLSQPGKIPESRDQLLP